ncbi:MAG: Rrf2 family transcriptional regulator [Venatoribacter sp.]
MLRVSKLTDYGVLILHTLIDAGAVLLSADELAERSCLNLPTVRKVLKTMVDSGLIKAQRGAGGGYRLARAAAQIRVLDIVQAFEGPIVSAEQDETDAASLASINHLLAQVLARISLEDLRHSDRQDQWIKNAIETAPYIELVNI